MTRSIGRRSRDKGDLFGFQLRNAHVRFVLIAFADKRIDPGNCAQLNLRLLPSSGLHQVGGRASQSVAGAFGLAAISIEDP